MKYSVKTGSIGKQRTDCIIVNLSQAKALARALGVGTSASLALNDFEDKPGKTTTLVLTKAIKRALVVGGASGKVSTAGFRKVLQATSTALLTLPGKSAIWALEPLRLDGKAADAAWQTRNALATLSTAFYSFDAQKQEVAKPNIKAIGVLATGKTAKSIRSAVTTSQALDTGMALSRDLGNTPPNICNPTYLLREARKMARNPKVTVKSLDEKEMTRLGMGAFMSVSQGSDTPGKMIIIQYKGGKVKEAPHVLVGKGITFDTGGISLKPGPAMDEMKFDMCGAASVLGTTRSVIDARLKINLVTIVAAAENMPSGKASRPGDVVSTMSGQTVEILNTDAEGRLVLCDALTYAERYKPKSVIDVATLTGAVVVALGSHAAAVYSNNDKLSAEIIEAGNYMHDRAWPMPLWDDYQSQLRSNFADMANIGGREAGSVTAACFLARFAKAYPWAHLDIAGVGYHSGARKGASGRPVPLLFQYLLDQA